MTDLSRRGAIGFGLAAGAAALSAGAAVGAAAKPGFFGRTGMPIGLQLYTLGDALRTDLDGMLSQVAKIGYRTVEMAGYLGRTPAELKGAFDKAGLKCTSAHVQAASGPGGPGLADIDKVIADAHIIGWRHVVLPMFQVPERIKTRPGEERRAYLTRIGTEMTADDWKACAALLNAKGKALKAAGLQMGYHNHNVEFAPVGGTTGLEILLKETDPALVQFEMDVGWVVAAGVDPATLMKAHPHRFTMMHVKDVKATTKPNFAFEQDPTEIGSGIIDWKTLLPAAYAGGVKEFFVEQEPPFVKPRLEAIKIGFDYLNGLPG